MNIKLLHKMMAAGYVNTQKHPEANLYIYNYSAKAQYEQVWNEITLACRGLILDDGGGIIARPFVKFFNLGELEDQDIPAAPFEVFEKMDGSLGISYSLNEKVYIATRGSFISDQALKATEMLHRKYPDAPLKMRANITYLFEIIYPKNRIVVDYGEEEKLVLIAMIDKTTGTDIALEDIGVPCVKKYNGITDIATLSSLAEENKEGFVIKYENGFRLKIKFEEYVRLHKIITQVSSITIWEHLKNEESMDELLENVPDELYKWIKKEKANLLEQYKNIEHTARSEMKMHNSRKEAAAYIMDCAYPKVMFAMLDDIAYANIIWRTIRPEFKKPF